MAQSAVELQRVEWLAAVIRASGEGWTEEKPARGATRAPDPGTAWLPLLTFYDRMRLPGQERARMLCGAVELLHGHGEIVAATAVLQHEAVSGDPLIALAPTYQLAAQARTAPRPPLSIQGLAGERAHQAMTRRLRLLTQKLAGLQPFRSWDEMVANPDGDRPDLRSGLAGLIARPIEVDGCHYQLGSVLLGERRLNLLQMADASWTVAPAPAGEEYLRARRMRLAPSFERGRETPAQGWRAASEREPGLGRLRLISPA
jgi:hypothetical protein